MLNNDETTWLLLARIGAIIHNLLLYQWMKLDCHYTNTATIDWTSSAFQAISITHVIILFSY